MSESERTSLDPTDLGPFSPPADYEFEPELSAMVPRPIPHEIRSGRYARRTRLFAVGCIVGGLLGVACHQLPLVRTFGLYFLPLNYVHWIGGIVFFIGLGSVGAYVMGLGPFKYVREGVPTVVRIRDIGFVPTMEAYGQATRYCCAAIVEAIDPTNREESVFETRSKDFLADHVDKMTTTYRVGDYATAVYLRSDPAGTLRLYGLLELKPGLGILRENEDECGSFAQLCQLLLGIFALTLFFAGAFWNVYAYGRFVPIDGLEFESVPFVLGAVVLGGALLGLIFALPRYQARKRLERNEAAASDGAAVVHATEKTGVFAPYGPLLGIVLIAGGLLMGGLTGQVWYYSANALLDQSPAELRPIDIHTITMTTRSYIFREYTISFHFRGKKRLIELMSTPYDLAPLVDQHKGLAITHAGRFGHPWVRTVIPAILDGELE